MIERDMIDFIKMKLAQKYPTFGNGSYSIDNSNPIAIASMGRPMTFAAGIEVEDVVLTIMHWHKYLLDHKYE